jgi:signal transduction histidine kinase/CheY-like chemotaxis protein
VNLKFIWDVVSQIKVGDHGLAYVVDSQGRLIAHPDLSLVLRNTNLSNLPQVQAARATSTASDIDHTVNAVDLQNRPVLSAYAEVPSLGWLVFVHLPIGEAHAPLYSSLLRSGGLLLFTLILAFVVAILLARGLTVPIQALHAGAARIGSGDLGQRISIKTGDELEALGDQFNNMAARLQELYATLERKVEERTRQLEAANLAKSRFLAAASHDLRQPLQALGMFVAQLNERMRAAERRQIVQRIETALAAMNELFTALLDISKLDAGVLKPQITEFPVNRLLNQVETTFAGVAREKGLSLRIIPSRCWIRSDFILLQRIICNLVSNAARYTNRGGIVVGCRLRGATLNIEVWDTGIGIPADQHQSIFDEFYRLGELDKDRRGGLGLGLAIVHRLCGLLDHPVSLTSKVGKGSRFVVAVPCAPAGAVIEAPKAAIRPAAFGASQIKTVWIIDDDPLVRDGMGSLLKSWGCRVVVLGADRDFGSADVGNQTPDLIVSDYHLAAGKTGVEVAGRLRAMYGAKIPVFLMSGDTSPELLRAVRASGYHLLHKPVEPMELRGLLSHALNVEHAHRPEGTTLN